MPTLETARCDVVEVEKQLKQKNFILSKLESKVRLFHRMIRSGIVTPDVDNFSKNQATLHMLA